MALVVAEQLCDALSDMCQSFELWQYQRVVAKLPPIGGADGLRERAQAIVVEREEAMQSSAFAIRSSQRLLDRLNQARGQSS